MIYGVRIVRAGIRCDNGGTVRGNRQEAGVCGGGRQRDDGENL